MSTHPLRRIEDAPRPVLLTTVLRLLSGVLFALLATLVLFFHLQQGFTCHKDHDRTLNDLRDLHRGLEHFKTRYGVYPPQTNWMNEVLAREPAPINRGMKIYYEASYGNLPIQDRWDRDFVYVQPGVRNPHSFDLYSLGKDGVTRSNGDDPDDLAAWHSSDRVYWHYEPMTYVMTSPVMGLLVLAPAVLSLILKAKRTLRCQGKAISADSPTSPRATKP